MDITAKDKNLSRLTNPCPDNELREILKGTDFEDYKSPLFLALQLNSACNLNCLHCCQEAGHSLPDELSKDESLDLCRQIIELDIPYVAISGGEPLLCPHVFDVCGSIRSSNISLKIETNGELIDKQAAEKLASLKLLSVQISLDGATPQTHESLRVAGNWRKVISVCKMLVECGVNTEVVFVPTPFNIHESLFSGCSRLLYRQNNADRQGREKLGCYLCIAGAICQVFQDSQGEGNFL